MDIEDFGSSRLGLVRNCWPGEISSVVKMTYGPLHRTAWACVIAWIIFACSRGYGGTSFPAQSYTNILTFI
jgi:hypothetical protein